MLTIFTHCKKFEGHIATIQRNAIQSWLRLRPDCEILLFGIREGTAEVATELGVRHVPEVAYNEFGTPLVNDLFEKAQRMASCDILCYVNCDIILGSEFIPAIKTVSQWRQRFLMVGECWNLDVTEPLPFVRPNWEADLRALVLRRGTARGPFGIDYFVFSRWLFQNLPPFAFGRAYFDNWLIWKARSVKAAVVDSTHSVPAVHQNHDYAHIPEGQMGARFREESMRNLQLAGGLRHRYLIFDTTHSLKPTGLRRKWGYYFRVRYRWEFARAKAKSIRLGALFWRFADFTRPVRHPLGLRLATVERFKSYLTRQG